MKDLFEGKATFKSNSLRAVGGFCSGPPGKDGVSPAVEVIEIKGGHRMTIWDAGGVRSFDIMDGVDGTGTGNMVKELYDPEGKSAQIATAEELLQHAFGEGHISGKERELWNSKADGSDFVELVDSVGGIYDSVQAHMEDDVIHLTARERSVWNAKAESGDIPTKTSQLENDSGFLTDISAQLGRSTAVDKADENYTAVMARGSALLPAGVFDAVTDWSEHLVNGSVVWRYE